MTARALAFLVWAVVAATAMLWALRLFVTAPAAPAYTVPVSAAAGNSGDLARLLGREPTHAAAAAEPAAPSTSSRFKLIGVVAPKPGRAATANEGFAVISVDGKPSRTYRIGAAVDGELLLQAVSARGAQLGPNGGPATVELALPPPAAAATGVLPNATAPVAYAPPRAAPAQTPAPPAPRAAMPPQPNPELPLLERASPTE